MGSNSFIIENSRTSKVKAVLITVFLFLALAIGGIVLISTEYALIKNTPFLDNLSGVIKADITELTPLGLFYSHFIGGIFFVPSLDEFIFYFALTKGNPIILSFILANTGYLLAQIVNYWTGVKLSSFIFHLVSKKKMYYARRLVNKYGAYGIFFFNLVPSPAPLLTLALGIAGYNKSRLLIFTALGKGLKYIGIIIIYLIIHR